MFGWFLTVFRDYLQLHYPEKSWEQLCEQYSPSMMVELCPIIDRHENLPDRRVLHLIRKIIEDMKPIIDANLFLREAGAFYLHTLINQGYDSLLRCLGGNIEDWLSNINKIHFHLDAMYPNCSPPEFWCVSSETQNVNTPTGHHEFFFFYHSHRSHATDLFIPFINGLVNAVAMEYFSLQIISMSLQSTQGVDDAPHTSWNVVTAPLQNKHPRISARKVQTQTPRSGRCPFRDGVDSQHSSGIFKLSSQHHFFGSRSWSSDAKDAKTKIELPVPCSLPGDVESLDVEERLIMSDFSSSKVEKEYTCIPNSSPRSSLAGPTTPRDIETPREAFGNQAISYSNPDSSRPPKTGFWGRWPRYFCFNRAPSKLVPVTPRSSGCNGPFGLKPSTHSFSSPLEDIFFSLGLTVDMAAHLYPFYILFDITSLQIINAGITVSDYVELTNPSAGTYRTMKDIFLVHEPKNFDWNQVQSTLETHRQHSTTSLVITVTSIKPSLRCPRDTRPQGFRMKGQIIFSQSYDVTAALFLATPDVGSISDMLSQGLTLLDLENFPLAQSLVIQSEILMVETRLSFKKEKQAEVTRNATHTLANQLKTVATKAEEALDVKKIFVRTVSHEIRTPLTVAKIGLFLLGNDFSAYSRQQKMSLDPIPQEPPIAEEVDASRHSEIKETIRDIGLSIDTAIDILNDLLAYEKLESGLLVTYKSLEPVHKFISEAINPFRLQAKEKSITLTIENINKDCFHESGSSLDVEDMFIYIDQKKMSQVIRNLLSNAIKFTPESGSVIVKIKYSADEISTVVDPSIGPYSDEEIVGKVFEIENMSMRVQRRGTLTLEFIDTGVGITKENQQKLFQEIIQFSPDKLQGGGGSGLGLWISSRIIALHGGTIGVWSEGLGSGTTFYFSVPLYAYVKDRKMVPLERLYTIASHVEEVSEIDKTFPSESLNVHSFESSKTPQSPISHLSILVVDDAPSIRKIMVKTLQSIGCTCDTAVDGHTAIEKVRKSLEGDSEGYNLILMDGIMIPMNGLDATREILKLGYRGLIFGATGNVMPDDIQQFLTAGAHEVLVKPLSLSDIEAAYLQQTRTKTTSLRS